MNGVPTGTPRARTSAAAHRRAPAPHGLARRSCPALIVLFLTLLPGGALAQSPELAPLPGGPAAEVPVDETQPLADVRIEGNTTIPALAISRYIKSRPGRPTTQRRIREDVRALHGTRWFYSVQPKLRESAEGPVLVFEVVERPIVKKVEFRGASSREPWQFWKTDLEKHLRAETGLKVGSPFDPAANRESVRRIERFYKDRGYYFAKVKLLKGGDRDDREVVFEIDEGEVVRVNDVDFVGNDFVSDAVLKTKLQTKIALLRMIGGKYDPSTIPNDVNVLKQYYHGLGFFDVRVGYREEFTDDKDGVTIEYKIDEGERYRIRNVDLVGNQIFSERELVAKFKLEEGDYFNERELNEDLESVRDRYGETGRIFAKIEAGPRYLEEPGVIDVVYRIDEDKPYRIRRINVHVNGDHPHTRRQVALNYLRFSPGDLADPKEIDFARRRLAGIRVFDGTPGRAPEINITPVPDEELYALSDVFRAQDDDVYGRVNAPPPIEDGPASRKPPRSPRSSARRAPAAPRPDARRVEASTGRRGGWSLDAPAASASRPRPRRTVPEARIPKPSPRRRAPVRPEYEVADVETVFRGQNPEPLVAQGRNPFYPEQYPEDYRFDDSPQPDPFGDVRRTPPPGYVPTVQPRLLDLDLYLNEAQTGRLMFGVGVNSDAGVVGNVSLQEDNFDLFRPPRSFADIANGTAWRGAGQRLRIEAVPGNVVSRYLVSWTDPYVFDTDYSLSLSGFYFNRFYDDWDENRGGGRVAIGRQLGPTWSVTGTYRIEAVEIANIRRPAPPILQEAEGDNLLQTFALQVANDTRDSPFLPTEGHYYSAEAEQAVGDFHFTRLIGEANHYFTTYSRPDGGGRHVLTVGGEVGWLTDDAPIFERFWAGGFQTFRGFDFRGVSPVEQGVRVGGNFLLLGTVEYKIPVTADENIAWVGFTDFGTVEQDVQLDNFRAAVGTGLRVTVPAMGPVPLAFDFAVPVAKQDFDDERIFSFYVGIMR